MGGDSAESKLMLTEVSSHRVIQGGEGTQEDSVQPLSHSKVSREFEMLWALLQFRSLDSLFQCFTTLEMNFLNFFF